MTNVEIIAEELNGKIWKKNDMIRVYLKPNFKQNQSVYVSFDVEEECEVKDCFNFACLKVWTETPNTDAQWRINASKQLKHAIMLKIKELTGCEVCEHWQQVIL